MINIERTSTDQGYVSKDYETPQATVECNAALENGQMVFMDGKPFMGEVVSDGDLDKVKSICITNKLTGG